MGRIARFAVVIGFGTFISLPLIATALGWRSVAVENRSPIAAPDLSPSALFAADTYQDVDAFLTDRMPFRSQAIWAANWVEYSVFSTSPNPEVSLGSDGWLFFTESIRQECLSPIEVTRVVGEIALIGDLVRASGREFRFFVVPDKATIYPQHLGGLVDDIECAEWNRARLRRLLEQVPDVVELWDVFDGVSPTGGLLYHRTDSHWNTAGAAIAARTLVDSIQPDRWDADAVRVVVPEQQRLGDLTGHIGLSFTEKVEVYGIDEVLAAVSVETTFDNNRLVATTSRSSMPTSIQGTTLFVHDSFGQELDPFLRPYFDELRSAWFYGDRFMMRNPWLLQLAAGSDTVVVASANRDLYPGFADDGLSLLMVAALADDLPGTAYDLEEVEPAGDRLLLDLSGAGGAAITAEALVPSSQRRAFLVVDVGPSGGVVRLLDRTGAEVASGTVLQGQTRLALPAEGAAVLEAEAGTRIVRARRLEIPLTGLDASAS